MKRRSWLCCACIGLSLPASLPAGAVGDLTGTYEGKLRCVTTVDGVVEKTKQDVSVAVIDAGDQDGVTLEIFGVADRIAGLLIEDAIRDDRGILPAVSCDYEAFDPNGVVVRLEGRTKLGAASLKGIVLRTSISLPSSASSSSCTLDVKRVSTDPPDIEVCTKIVPI
jgi:autotransporter translocation and assembly factor TamB